MRATPTIAKELPKPGTGSTGEETSEDFPSLPRHRRIEAARARLSLVNYDDSEAAELDEVVAPFFKEAVDVWGLPKNYASRISVRESHFSEMLAGKRPVALRHLIPLHEKPKAMLTFFQPWCERSGLTLPVEKTELQLSDGEARLLGFLMSTPLWPLLGPIVARQFYHVGVETLDVAVKNHLRMGAK